MDSGTYLRIVLIAAGVILFMIILTSLAHRRMTESFCLSWGVISLVFIISGIFLRPSGWQNYISHAGLVLIFLIGVAVVYGIYFMSWKVSDLLRKNSELAIQMSLMIAERDEMKARIEKLEQKLKSEDDPS